MGKKSVQLDSDRVYQLCNSMQLFTMGNTEQYQRMFNMIRNNAPLEDVALVIWICSVDRSRKQIEDALRETCLVNYTP